MNAIAIAALNDALRRTLQGGRVVMTARVAALPPEQKLVILQRVRMFNHFTEENDPYGEHDFGAFKVDGERYLFKIDYYDLTLTMGSEDPADPEQTCRVLTIMHASDY